MDREVKSSIQEVEEEIYKRISISSNRLRQKKIRIEVNVLNYMIRGVLFIKYEDR